MTESKVVASSGGSAALAGNVTVLGAIGAVSLAIGVAAGFQLGMPAWASLMTGCLAACGLTLLHLALMRGRRITELEHEVAQLWAAVGTGSTSSTGTTQPAKAVRTAPARAGEAIVARSRAPAPAATPEPATPEPAAPEPQGGKPDGGHDDSALDLASEMALARALADHDQDQHDLDQQQQAARPAAASPDRQQALSPAAGSRSLDPAAIHELVKRLAKDAAKTGQATGTSTRLAAAVQESPPPTTTAAGPTTPARAEADSDELIATSVRALRATADSMRGGDAARLAVDDLEAADATGAVEGQGAQDRVEALAEALAADRIDVLLAPILGLHDQATRHYEVSIGLRAADDQPLDIEGNRRELSGTGILPLIDLAKLARVAEIARRLSERGKSGAVFAGFAGESIGDDDFLARLSEVYGERSAIIDQLVVALAQEDVRVFAPAHWEMVKELCSAGFRFALEHVTDLDMDFDMLRASGVHYVKMDAAVLLEGLPAAEGIRIPPVDVCGFLVGKGLNLIVDHIDSEAQLMRVVDCGALYGQGRLFGGARPVKAQVFAPRPAAA